MCKQPIGIFDSGVGGTSIWKEIVDRLPNENTVYLADSKNAPYGTKTPLEILNICKYNTEYLISKGAKIIVVACNTATTNTISTLRQTYNIPFIGIEPAIKPAVLATKTQAIGILATKGTLSSALFCETAKKITGNINLIEQEGTGLVELIENNKIYSSEMDLLLNKLLSPMKNKQVDHIVLGCTHYPYLIPQIQKILGTKIKIIDSGFAVAKQTENILNKFHLLNNSKSKGTHSIITNSSNNTIENLVGNRENSKFEYIDF
ncbi:glutamate racemase [Flavobacteriaceae bacterium]|nr:glutamate racemase [Flavobacteriaceae bacterium]